MRTASLIIAMSGAVLLAGCASTVRLPEARCSQLVPQTWEAGIEGADIPPGDETAEWQKAFVQQTGQLEKANGRTADAIGIVQRCEAMVNEARQQRGWFR